MAESIHMGSVGNSPIYQAAANDIMASPARRPSTAQAGPRLALSHPDRKSMDAAGNWKSASLRHTLTAAKARPSTALGLRVTGTAMAQHDGAVSSPTEAPPRLFGRMSLYDVIDDNKEAHVYMGESNFM